MHYQTLENSITTLQKLRDAHHSQLDASALAELDRVLQQLRDARDGSDKRRLGHGELVTQTLRIAEIVIRAVSNISDWMK